VADVSSREGALSLIKKELELLAMQDKNKPATTLIVYPLALFELLLRAKSRDFASQEPGQDVLDKFEEFLEFGEAANKMAQEMAEEGLAAGDALLLTFHPESTFSEVPNDPCTSTHHRCSHVHWMS
jgi:hypothetical protein